MPSSREKRAQRHQSQSKQNVERFSGRGKTTQNIPGAGYREVQLIGNKKYYTPLSDDPNQTLGGSTGDTNVTVTGGGGGTSNHGALSGLNLDSHPQYILTDGTRAFTGNVTVGTDGSGYDVTFYSETAGDSFVWDASEELLTITGTDGQVALDVADGDVTIADTLTATNIGAFTLTGKLTAGATEIEGSAFDIDGGTVDGITSLTVANDVDIGNFKLEAKALEASDLNVSGGVVFAGSNGLLEVDSDITFATDTLTVTKIGAFELTGKLTAGSSEIEGSAFDIDGGDISAVTISGGLTWNYAQDLNSQELTNVNIDSGAIDAVTIGTNSVATRIKVDSLDLDGYTIESTSTNGLQLIASGTGGDLEMDIVTGKLILIEDTDNSAQTEFLNDGGNFSIKTISGDILLDSSSGNFYFRKDGDDGTKTLMTVNDLDGEFTIDTADSGNITLKPSGGHVYVNDGSNNIIEFDGAEPSITIKDDADTDDYFKITVGSNGGTVFTTVDDAGTDASLTMTLDGYFKVDSEDEIVLDVANGESIIFKEDGSSIFTFDPSSPELTVFGIFTINPSGGLILEENGVEVIKIDTDRNILFNQYNQTPYNFYGWNNQATLYHFTTGYADFQENLSCISMFEDATTSEAYPI